MHHTLCVHINICFNYHFQTGGEMYFSDIYSNQPVPESLRENKILWGEFWLFFPHELSVEQYRCNVHSYKLIIDGGHTALCPS